MRGPHPTRARHARTWLRAAALWLLPLSCSRPGPRWNVVLITLDTTRADALSCYGGPSAATPALDALAAAGTRFDLALSSAALTPVAHASILTGLENREHGLRVMSAGSGFRLPPDVPTLASVLREQGYATLAVQGAFPVSSWFGFDRGFERFESFDTRIDPGSERKNWNVLEFQRRSDAVTDLALECVRGARRPFFLWTHYWDPHDPLLIPPEEFLPADLPRDAQGHPSESRALYDAEIRYMDREIGRLVEGLKRSGEYERTLFVVVADHGEGLGEHGWWHHRILYQEELRVPLLLVVPGRASTPPVEALVRTIDIYPTLLEALGLDTTPHGSARSLLPLLDGRSEEPRTAFADAINGYDHNAAMLAQRPLDDFVYAVVREGWKLLYRPAHREANELFELASDPREARNRFASEPARALELELALAREQPFVTRPFPDEPAQQQGVSNVLQALGYTAAARSGPAAEAWRWSCPAHPQTEFESNRPCKECGSPMLPFVRGR
ncbi:MAG: sulfatase [Planctomycetes bacterium]|nr:sulfatase [Planctomycetota bacterium]